MADEHVTIYRSSEPGEKPGWRSLEESKETASVSYDVPQDVWDDYVAAQTAFERATDALVMAATGEPAS